MKPTRKIIASFFALFFILSAALSARAEIKKLPRFSISLGAGFSVPLGYLTEKYSVGGNAGIEISFRFYKSLSLFALFHHSYFKWNAKNLDADVYSHEGGEFGCYSYFGGLKGIFRASNRLALSAAAGAGIAVQESGCFSFKGRKPGPGGGWVEYETITYNILRPGTFFSVIAGAGLEYDLSRWFALFAEARLIVIFNTERTPPPEWAGLDPDVYQNPPEVVFLPIMIGLSFKI